jgi:glutaminyl-tRNA synthetase
MLSKRKLLLLVQKGYVSGWDDPRMPTLSGIRRRGYTPEALRAFCGSIGVSKTNGTIEFPLLEHHIREDLNARAARVMAVVDPIKVIIDNYPDGQTEELEAANHPDKPEMGMRKVPFSKVLYIERDDFREVPPPKYYRLFPGQEVRLRYAYFIKCVSVVKDANGEVTEVHCTYDPASRGGNSPDGRKVKSTIHWVSAEHALTFEARLYESLLLEDSPQSDDIATQLNPTSLVVKANAKIEPSVKGAAPNTHFQFERVGYFNVDLDSTDEKLVCNRTVQLKDTWAKIAKK